MFIYRPVQFAQQSEVFLERPGAGARPRWACLYVLVEPREKRHRVLYEPCPVKPERFTRHGLVEQVQDVQARDRTPGAQNGEQAALVVA